MISKLGYKPKKKLVIKSEHLKENKNLTIIIPVKNNQKGIDLFLDEFFKPSINSDLPYEIIIVDNNSNPAVKLQQNNYPTPVQLLVCTKMGPASARNAGIKKAKTDWIIFTDSDCVPTKSFLEGYLKSQNGSIGYAGNIKAYKNSFISKYYEQQEILLPPKVYEESNLPRPDYLITANCMIWKPALEIIGGFDEEIKIAGGEDIDLGFRLLEIGNISYAFESIVLHNFEESIQSFIERFKRYGYGNRIISDLYNLDLKPRLFKPNVPSLVNYFLAFIQFISLRIGYQK